MDEASTTIVTDDSDVSTFSWWGCSKYYDHCWEGTNKADKKKAKDVSTFMNGRGGNDKLTGGSKNDKLEGNDGKDKLDGGSGNDELQGGKGNDTLIGANGNDKFEDDEGKNVFTGGKGDDLFIIDDDDDGFVKVTDFNSKEDKLQIDDDYKKFEDMSMKVKGGNLQIRLDGEYVAELIGITKPLTNSMIVWD